MNLTGQTAIKGIGTNKSIHNFLKKHFHKDKPISFFIILNS
jgi:hypothetical protein